MGCVFLATHVSSFITICCGQTTGLTYTSYWVDKRFVTSHVLPRSSKLLFERKASTLPRDADFLATTPHINGCDKYC